MLYKFIFEMRLEGGLYDIKRAKRSMHSECICDPGSDECVVRKEAYNRAIQDVIVTLDNNKLSKKKVKNINAGGGTAF